jgi:hypothetical protein
MSETDIKDEVGDVGQPEAGTVDAPDAGEQPTGNTTPDAGEQNVEDKEVQGLRKAYEAEKTKRQQYEQMLIAMRNQVPGNVTKNEVDSDPYGLAPIKEKGYADADDLSRVVQAVESRIKSEYDKKLESFQEQSEMNRYPDFNEVVGHEEYDHVTGTNVFVVSDTLKQLVEEDPTIQADIARIPDLRGKRLAAYNAVKRYQKYQSSKPKNAPNPQKVLSDSLTQPVSSVSVGGGGEVAGKSNLEAYRKDPKILFERLQQIANE